MNEHDRATDVGVRMYAMLILLILIVLILHSKLRQDLQDSSGFAGRVLLILKKS